MNHLKTILLSTFLLFLLGVKGQQNHFIYIQTENKQPFYLKLDSKLYSSSATGYVVLSKLKEGAYNIAVGFPKSEWPEQQIVVQLVNKDLGYLLKNFGEKGWGLFNLQTLDVVMANERKKSNIAVETKSDEFSNLLSNVVNDPTIRQVEKTIEPIKEPTKEPAKDPVVLEVTPTPEEKIETVAHIAIDSQAAIKAIERSVIKRSFMGNSKEGTEMVFTDRVDGRTDTITVFIPLDKVVKEKSSLVREKLQEPGDEKKASTQQVKSSEPTIEYNTQAAPVVKKEEKVPERKFLDIDLQDSVKKADKKALDTQTTTFKANDPAISDSQPIEKKSPENSTEQAKKERGVPTIILKENKAETPKQNAPSIIMKEDKPAASRQNSPMINSDCKSVASDDDFIKLRKKMVGEDNDEDMIALAKKTLKSKCFSVEQIKNISVLFLKDVSKYAFFDVAYPFVSDSHNFSSLQAQLTDPYYVSRFQAMIRH